MKLATCSVNDEHFLALIDASWQEPENGRALLLTQQPGWKPQISTMQQLIESGNETFALLQQYSSEYASDKWVPLTAVRLCPPIPTPIRNIMCLGWNYAEHAEESSSAKGIQIAELPRHPIVFTKATTTVNGPFDDIFYDERVSRRLDWEVELGVIIGKQGRHISQENALDYVFGYTVINDVSARDLQKRHQQFFLGKSMDGTCPMGPWIVTADEIPDPQKLNLYCKVNGVEKQNANTDQQIFSVANVISTLSRVMTLLPGDIIATGTPSGVGFARQPPEYLQPGDSVECAVQNVGKIVNLIR